MSYLKINQTIFIFLVFSTPTGETGTASTLSSIWGAAKLDNKNVLAAMVAALMPAWTPPQPMSRPEVSPFACFKKIG
jgi:hypothetical protein